MIETVAGSSGTPQFSGAFQLYENAWLIDSSAALALVWPRDHWHQLAHEFYKNSAGDTCFILRPTRYEAFTRIRYDVGFDEAIRFLAEFQCPDCQVLDIEDEDERIAETTLEKYGEHRISYHDALCIAVMSRLGLYKIFAFDSDFWTIGEGILVVPGPT